MKLGFVSAILPEEPVDSVFQIARDLEYECVELMCWPPGPPDRRYAGVTHVDVTRFSDDSRRHLHTLVRDSGVEISALGYYPNVLSPDAEESANAAGHLRKVFEAAAALGVGVNTFIGRDPRLTLMDNWPRMLKVWRPLLELASDLGVPVGIENCPMLFSRDEWPGGKNLATCPPVWRKLFEELDCPLLGLNYDPSHLVWQQIDWIQPIFEFADRIFHVHAKDVVINRDALAEFGILALPSAWHEPRIPGRGEIGWSSFVTALDAAGYKGPLCVEVEDREFEDSREGRLQSLRLSHQCLRPLVR